MISLNEKILGFECCFCGESIQSSNADPMKINIMGNYDKVTQSSGRPNQDFYCHFQCMKDRLHEKMSYYFLQDIFDLDEDSSKIPVLNDKFIDLKEIQRELKTIEHFTFDINRRVELIFQYLRYIFHQIKTCKSEDMAMNYFDSLEAIQDVLAVISFSQGISLPDRMAQFVYDFDNFERARDYYFPKVRNGEYRL